MLTNMSEHAESFYSATFSCQSIMVCLLRSAKLSGFKILRPGS